MSIPLPMAGARKVDLKGVRCDSFVISGAFTWSGGTLAGPQGSSLTAAGGMSITSAGLNTVLESLAHGVPTVAIPIGYDQPGTAARIAYHRTGEVIELDELTTERLRSSIEKVLHDPSYRVRANYFRRVISKKRGLDVAADIIERALIRHAALAYVNAK